MSERTELDEAADCAPFDRVEQLARRLCADAGGDWERKGTRRAHWRAQAAAALATPCDDTLAWANFARGLWVGALGGALLSAMVVQPMLHALVLLVLR